VYSDRFHNISYNYLLNNNIEGIYETKMPLKFRAVTDLGCVIRPRKNVIPNNEQAQGRTYSMNELEILKPNQLEQPYLSSDSYEKMYLFHHNCG
jgi:hypothetical protein